MDSRDLWLALVTVGAGAGLALMHRRVKQLREDTDESVQLARQMLALVHKHDKQRIDGLRDDLLRANVRIDTLFWRTHELSENDPLNDPDLTPNLREHFELGATPLSYPTRFDQVRFDEEDDDG